jgi:YVTN family beta-propeller protein
LTIDPSGRFLFVANTGSNNVSVFHIDPATGALNSVPGSPVVAGSEPRGIAVDPTARFVFVTNAGSLPSISVFGIDASTGRLTAVAGSPFSSTAAVYAAVDASGRFLYAASRDNAEISVFRIGANGALSSSGGPFPAHTQPQSLFLLDVLQ